jgi:hypothetical protein
VANEPKADGGDARAKNAPGRALYDHGNRNPGKVGSQRNNQQRRRNRSRPGSDNGAPRLRDVDKLAAGNLRDETRKPTGAQYKSDVRRVPSAIRKMDRNKRTEPGQESSEEEIQPIERMLT